MKSTRRQVLKASLSTAAVVSMAASMPAFLQRFAFAQAGVVKKMTNQNVLVVVQLSGGNDGLNTVIPVRDDAYFKARPRIGLKDKLVKLNDDLSLNPGMTALKEIYDAGKLAVINGCGYPNPNRSHFRSMEIWHTGNPKEFETCGWLGHYLDHYLKGTDAPLKAANLGSELPQALVAESAPVPSINGLEDFRVKTDSTNPADAKASEKIIRDLAMKEAIAASPALEFLHRQAANAILSADQVRKLAAGYKTDVVYPNGLGNTLKLIAQMINANLGTRIFYCQTGGYDTHANQLQGHENILASLSNSLAAFHKDLDAKGIADNVTVMVFSEFGRRVSQNDSNGTDHGAAGPMFLLGGKIKGGVHGKYPSLTDLDDGDLKYTTDFRRVYATILDKWMNADSEKVLKSKFAGLELFA